MTDSERRRLSNADIVALLAELEIPTLSHRLVGGYSPKATRALLGRAATTIQTLRQQEQQQVQPETEAAAPAVSDEELREALGDVFVAAHRAAEQLREEATEQADRIIQAAREEATAIAANASVERRQLERDLVSLRAEYSSLQTRVDEVRSQWQSINDALRHLSDLAAPQLPDMSSDLRLVPPGDEGAERDSAWKAQA